MTESEQLAEMLAEMLRDAAETVDRLVLRVAVLEAEVVMLRGLVPYPPER